MNKNGILTVVSGFSGAGKGTVMKTLLSQYHYRLSVSATTRKPRPGETNGKDYFFLTTEEFESMIAKKELIEWAKYVEHYYGTPKKFVMDQLAAGENVILEIEIQGALKVKEQFPDALLLFLTPPSAYELKNRLVGRGSENMDTINKRLKRAKEEAEYMNAYDYVVVNDKLDDCVEQVNQIIINEACRAFRRLDFIEELKKEFSE